MIKAKKNAGTAKEDAVIAAENMNLIANTLGLGTCFIGLIPMAYKMGYKKLKKIINLPKDEDVYISFVIGTPKLKYRYMPQRKDRNVLFQ